MKLQAFCIHLKILVTVQALVCVLWLIDAGYIVSPAGKAIASYTKSATTSSMVSHDSVFPPPPPTYFNGFLAPEYASQPTVIYYL